MSQHPSDRELDRLLAELPRESASPGFSRRVLADIDGPARPAAGRRWLMAAAATAVALAVGLWLLPRAPQSPSPAETRALQEEHQQLLRELDALKASLRQSQAAPVLYLGGNEHLDLVLDLGPVWQGEAGVRPAVYGAAERPLPAAERRRGDRR